LGDSGFYYDYNDNTSNHASNESNIKKYQQNVIIVKFKNADIEPQKLSSIQKINSKFNVKKLNAVFKSKYGRMKMHTYD